MRGELFFVWATSRVRQPAVDLAVRTSAWGWRGWESGGRFSCCNVRWQWPYRGRLRRIKPFRTNFRLSCASPGNGRISKSWSLLFNNNRPGRGRIGHLGSRIFDDRITKARLARPDVSARRQIRWSCRFKRIIRWRIVMSQRKVHSWSTFCYCWNGDGSGEPLHRKSTSQGHRKWRHWWQLTCLNFLLLRLQLVRLWQGRIRSTSFFDRSWCQRRSGWRTVNFLSGDWSFHFLSGDLSFHLRSGDLTFHFRSGDRLLHRNCRRCLFSDDSGRKCHNLLGWDLFQPLGNKMEAWFVEPFGRDRCLVLVLLLAVVEVVRIRLQEVRKLFELVLSELDLSERQILSEIFESVRPIFFVVDVVIFNVVSDARRRVNGVDAGRRRGTTVRWRVPVGWVVCLHRNTSGVLDGIAASIVVWHAWVVIVTGFVVSVKVLREKIRIF